MSRCRPLFCSQGKKPKLGLKESFRVLGKSKYLGFLATLVLGYGLCIAMTEGAARTTHELTHATANECHQLQDGVLDTIIVVFFFFIEGKGGGGGTPLGWCCLDVYN